MIDTLSIARNLTAAGFDAPQAEALADAIANREGQAATKDFVHAEVSPLRADMGALKWITGVNLAITLALLAVVLAG